MKILDIPVCSTISDFVPPLHSEQLAEAVEVKSVEFLSVPLVYCPDLAAYSSVVRTMAL